MQESGNPLQALRARQMIEITAQGPIKWEIQEDHFVDLCREIEMKTVKEFIDRCVLLAFPSFSFFLSGDYLKRPIYISIITEMDRCPLMDDQETIRRISAAGERIARIFEKA